MIGKSPTVEDVELELEPLVLPANLLSNESLSLDDVPEEEQVSPFQIDTYCHSCEARVRICVLSKPGAIRTLELFLLSADLSFVCTRCSRDLLQNHGRNT